MKGILCSLVRFCRGLWRRLGLLDWRGYDGRMEWDMIDTMGPVFYFIFILRSGDGHGDSALSISLVRDYFI